MQPLKNKIALVAGATRRRAALQWNWAQQVQPFMPLDVAPRLNALNTIVQKPLEETAELVNQARRTGNRCCRRSFRPRTSAGATQQRSV